MSGGLVNWWLGGAVCEVWVFYLTHLLTYCMFSPPCLQSRERLVDQFWEQSQTREEAMHTMRACHDRQVMQFERLVDNLRQELQQAHYRLASATAHQHPVHQATRSKRRNRQ